MRTRLDEFRVNVGGQLGTVFLENRFIARNELLAFCLSEAHAAHEIDQKSLPLSHVRDNLCPRSMR